MALLILVLGAALIWIGVDAIRLAGFVESRTRLELDREVFGDNPPAMNNTCRRLFERRTYFGDKQSRTVIGSLFVMLGITLLVIGLGEANILPF